MNPTVIDVKPQQDYTLHLWFKNGEEGIFDVKPYLDKGIFMELKDLSLFNSVHPDGLSIEWDNEAALCPDTVYLESVKI
ncbi:MAG: DUF2442 domain-containing protein [Prevotellaceae bacterium]|jgi:hypothetical protein|nr:DUF2442 domain-containing protein [Prevotellaceae bacterium]